MIRSILYKADGKSTEIETRFFEDDSKICLSIDKTLIPGDADHIDFCPDLLRTGPDANGYMVIPRGTKEGGTILCRFHERADTEYINDSNMIPVWGYKTSDVSYLAIVTGMAWDYRLVAGVKDNVYYVFPRFFVDPETTYENLTVELYKLPKNSGYNEMARFYRNRKLAEGCVPLKERVKNNPQLKYAAESIEIRIRMSWKPVPTPVEHQTEENEPEVVLAVTADRVIEIMDEMKRQGIRSAEICFVGVEKSGHDGRWPQFFPVEQKIGGETKLREAIEYGQKLGYQMVVHSNNTEMYQISEDWDEDKIIRQRDGSFLLDHNLWGGGRPYMMCPTEAVKFAQRDIPRIAELGFKGVHYIDVLSIFPPRKCYSAKHPINRKQSIACTRKIMELAHEYFGGFASEGGFDFAADLLDYVLYTSYNVLGKQPDIADEAIPFWQLIFHGIVLYNPCTETVNYCVKPEINHLKYIEYGGRPLAYYYSKYVDENPDLPNWMGDEDLTCKTDAELIDSVEKIKCMQEEYEKLSYLQYEFMERHEKVRPGVFEVEYSDGTIVTIDYNDKKYYVEKK